MNECNFFSFRLQVILMENQCPKPDDKELLPKLDTIAMLTL